MLRTPCKQVQGESNVAETLNRLTLTIQPNTPLYPGTLLTVNGLSGLQTSGCNTCTLVSFCGGAVSEGKCKENAEIELLLYPWANAILKSNFCSLKPCLRSQAGDNVPGLGCSASCATCKSPIRRHAVFQPANLTSASTAGPPGEACLNIFQDRAALVPHPAFSSALGAWDSVAGTLVLTVAATLPSASNTTVTFLVGGR